MGAVRVLPEADPSVDLLISGKILRSSGTELALQINATDSTGRSWLSAIYGDAAMLADYPEDIRFTPSRPFIPSEHQEPYQDLYENIGNDLVAIERKAVCQRSADNSGCINLSLRKRSVAGVLRTHAHDQ